MSKQTDFVTRPANNAARAIVKLVESSTRQELDFSVCMQIVEIVANAMHEGISAEQREALQAIRAHIKLGVLPGNGWDESAKRNGLVLASNLLANRLTFNDSETYGSHSVNASAA